MKKQRSSPAGTQQSSFVTVFAALTNRLLLRTIDHRSPLEGWRLQNDAKLSVTPKGTSLGGSEQVIQTEALNK